ncbi:MAG: hypothetical protein NT144_13265 [Bacteroidia bacterium]|nr:hypothetical protein [Bacteroidia bacterium]
MRLDLIERKINTEVLESFGFESIEYSEIEKHLYKCIEDMPESDYIFILNGSNL